jgi:hypothetical protein
VSFALPISPAQATRLRALAAPLASIQERRRIIGHGSATHSKLNDRQETTMKFMVAWRVPPQSYKAGVKRFLKTGGKTPKGLKSLGRWHPGR